MIAISDRTVALWFIKLDEESDLMAVLEQEGEDYFRLTYRFRHYVVEGHPFSGWDDKNWYRGDFRGSREKALKSARGLIKWIETQSGNLADEVMASSAEEYLEILKGKPYIHIRDASEEDIEATNGRRNG